MKRNDYLSKNGWEEPIDETPFETPDGWVGGGVVNTGGGIFARRWRNEEARVEVIYNLSDARVEADFLEYTEYGLINAGVVLTSKRAHKNTDAELQKCAEELVERFTPYSE